MHLQVAAALLPLVLLLGGCTALAASASVAPPQENLQLHKQHVPQILASIQEGLKSLSEALGGQPSYAIVAKPTSVDLDALARRLEAVETRLGRIESSLDTRLNTLSENIGRRHGKEEMAAEATSRKLESVSERIFEKIGYLSGQIDEKFKKLSTRVETYPTEVQRIFKTEFPSSSSCCHQLTMTVTAAESRLRKEISHVDQKVEEVKKIAKKFENVDINDLMQTLSQNLINYFADSRDKFVEFFKTEMVTLEAKIREICTDLWKRTMVIEEKVFQTSSVTNLTLFNVQEILKRGPKPNAGGGFDSYTRGHQQQGYYPTSMAGHSDRIILKINQLGKDIEYNFKTLLNNQIQFKDGCKRIQDGEVHIERTIEGYLIRIHENFVNETLNMKGLLEAFYGTDLQMSQKLEDIQIVLEQNNNIMIGDAKKIFTNLNVLRDSMNQYFKEFTVETVATKVSEDLKPILLKFVDEAVLAPTNFTQNTDGIFEELETIITLNKNNATEESPSEAEGFKADSQRQEDDYGDSAVDLTEDEAS